MTKEIKNEFHLLVSSPEKTAVDHLQQATKLSRQKIKQAMQKGCVWLEKPAATDQSHQAQYTQRLRRAKKIMRVGDTLHCYYDATILNSEPATARLLEDYGDYSIWDKPSGMLSQGSKWGDHCTINRWAEKHLQPQRPAFIVHRLDRAAQGLIIVAHKKQVAAAFAKMFQQHRLEKNYRVTVEGDFSTLLESNDECKILDTRIDTKDARSRVWFKQYDAGSDESILDVQIETGRKHQIRKHLSEQGFPVVGDRLYGSKRCEGDLKLQAVRLEFICPVSSEPRMIQI